MGLLDDAIREHLELKRQHGANAEEVAQQEREALGPARRARPAELEPDPDAPDAAPAFEDDAVDDREPDPVAPEAAPGFEDDEGDDREPPHSAPATAEGPEPGRTPAETPGAVVFQDAPDPVPLAPPPAEPDPVEEDPWLDEDDEPVRPSDEAATPSETDDEEPPAEDVLEETPDFLQETPEHDRLWFEQKPPRDFDWDR